jgi:hypothetical protein
LLHDRLRQDAVGEIKESLDEILREQRSRIRLLKFVALLLGAIFFWLILSYPAQLL